MRSIRNRHTNRNRTSIYCGTNINRKFIIHHSAFILAFAHRNEKA